MKRWVVACFVKTPGSDLVKTRLADDIGSFAANEFYKLSVGAISRKFMADSCFDFVWAVEEKDHTDPLWRWHSKVDQGCGDLGQRLQHVEQELKKAYQGVVFIGGDLPDILVSDVERAIERLESQPGHIVGPAMDGGFYLYAGNVQETHWTSISYSKADTLQQLRQSFGGFWHEDLPEQRDVDTYSDLIDLKERLKVNPSSEYQELRLWLESFEQNELSDLR